MNKIAPEAHIAEINLLGTGGGYGESLVIHIGNNEWVIIDSCQDPTSGKSIPLTFLASRGVDLTNVKLIVCTHWHDDHIRGIAEILENSPNAVFSFARANDLKKFLQLVSIDLEKLKKITSNSSTIEFNRCLEIISLRKSTIKNSEVDKLLYSTILETSKIEIFSLSPSELSNQIFDKEISSLIEGYSALNKRLISQSPNERSVVLLLKLGNHNILLGADLQVGNNPKLGWLDIANNSQVVKVSEKSKYFKIPHHGSENGHNADVWTKLLINKPIATLTPWNKKGKLPKKEMLDKYIQLTKELYITSSTSVGTKPKNRDVQTAKIIRQFNSSIQEIKFQFGVISSTINILNENSAWDTSLRGTAQAVTPK